MHEKIRKNNFDFNDIDIIFIEKDVKCNRITVYVGILAAVTSTQGVPCNINTISYRRQQWDKTLDCREKMVIEGVLIGFISFSSHA